MLLCSDAKHLQDQLFGPDFAASTSLVMENFRKLDVFIIAAWCAIFFGVLEGAALCVSRFYPLIQAAHKVSGDVLYVTPVLDLVLFLILASALTLALTLAGKWAKPYALPLAYGTFTFAGIYTVIAVPRVIHPYSAAILAAGCMFVLHRQLRGSEERLTAWLHRYLFLIPIIVAAVAVGNWGFGIVQEQIKVHRLSPAQPGATNVLVIVLDTVRADQFRHNNSTSLTPNLDRFTAEGVSFDNAWSTTSWSLPSQASILTGQYPHEHGADWPNLQVSKTAPTLPEFLAVRGYVTGAFSGNAAWVTPEYLGRGFLRFNVYILEDLLRRTMYGRKLDKVLDRIGYHSHGRGKKAVTVNSEFLRFLDDYPTRPFFAYLCYMDVNQGFHNRMFNFGDPKKVPMKEVVTASNDALRFLDVQIGQLLTELRRRKLLGNTIVVIAADHGESFGEQNPGDHDPFGHGTNLYREESAVPLFIIYPGKVPAGERVTASVSIRQIPATVTDLLRMADTPFSGESLSRVWEHGGAGAQSSSVFADLRAIDGKLMSQSVIRGNWQYLRNLNYRGTKPIEELYDLKTDWHEQSNLGSVPNSKILTEMRDDLQHLSSPMYQQGGLQIGRATYERPRTPPVGH